jgi:hypothetical protein
MEGPWLRHIGPQQISQVVARDPLTRFHGQADEEGEVLARAEADWLTGIGEQLRSAQREELQVRGQPAARGVF